jgi:hypothetical protein
MIIICQNIGKKTLCCYPHFYIFCAYIIRPEAVSPPPVEKYLIMISSGAFPL